MAKKFLIWILRYNSIQSQLFNQNLYLDLWQLYLRKFNPAYIIDKNYILYEVTNGQSFNLD